MIYVLIVRGNEDVFDEFCYFSDGKSSTIQLRFNKYNMNPIRIITAEHNRRLTSIEIGRNGLAIVYKSTDGRVSSVNNF